MLYFRAFNGSYNYMHFSIIPFITATKHNKWYAHLSVSKRFGVFYMESRRYWQCYWCYANIGVDLEPDTISDTTGVLVYVLCKDEERHTSWLKMYATRHTKKGVKSQFSKLI